MPADISLSTGAVIAVTGLLSVMAGAIGTLFLALRGSYKENAELLKAQIKREQDLTDTLLPSVREISQIVLRLAETMQGQGQESRDRMDRLERLTMDLREKVLTITNRGRSA